MTLRYESIEVSSFKVGIHKIKQEKHAFDQESDINKKKKENTLSTKKATKKKRKNFPFFLDHFLGRERDVVFLVFLLSLLSFINAHLRITVGWTRNLVRMMHSVCSNLNKNNYFHI